MIDFAKHTDVSVDAPDRELSEEGAPQPFRDEYLPTPEEIVLACRNIQKGWSEDERRRRGGFRRARKLPQVLRVHRVSFSS